METIWLEQGHAKNIFYIFNSPTYLLMFELPSMSQGLDGLHFFLHHVAVYGYESGSSEKLDNILYTCIFTVLKDKDLQNIIYYICILI